MLIGGGVEMEGDKNKMKADIQKLQLLLWDIVIESASENFYKEGKIGNKIMISALDGLQLFMTSEEFEDMLQTIKFIEEEAKEKYEKRIEHFDAIHDRIIANLQTLCREKMLKKD